MANTELADPPLILSLNLNGTPGTVGHLGIRYPEPSTVSSELGRAESDALEPLRETGVTCCYAKADKFWVRDADGIPWEMYTLLADAEPESAPARRLAPETPACGCAS
jgi:hypothetical protein